METAVSVLVIGLLSLWFILTLIYATPLQGRGFLKSIFLARFIPKWNFFAPMPGVHDYHLLHRDQFLDGSVGVWQEVSALSRPRSWKAAIWNPDKRAKKALYDLTMTLALAKPSADTDPNWIKLSIPIC